jgi:hypothetical protein
MKIKKNFELYKILRTEVLGEKKTQNKIEFKNVEKILKGKKKLLECLKKIAESPNTDIKQKKQIIKLLKAPEALDKINSKIVDIVYKYKYLPEDTIESLQTLDTKSLNDLLKEAKEMYLLKQEGKQMYEE